MSDSTAAEVRAERASIASAIEGKTLVDLLSRNATRFGDQPALNWEEGGAWRSLTWSEYREQVAALTLGLLERGLEPGQFAGIMAGNRPEHLIADMAIVHAAASPVTLYATLAPPQVQYVLDDCEATIVFCENRESLATLDEVRGSLPKVQVVVLMDDADAALDRDDVVAFTEIVAAGRAKAAQDPAAFENAHARVTPEDPATLIYTSGTTGAPKGVILSHRNVLVELEAASRVLDLDAGVRGISYLPLAHVAERMFSHYLGMHLASSVFFCPEVSRALEVVGVAKPNAFLAVPRVWEKMYAGVNAKLAAEPNERKRKLAAKAIAVGRECVRLEQAGTSVPFGLKVQRALFAKLVYAKILAGLNLDECTIGISGAAPVAEEILEFFCGIGLEVIEVYGLTETTAVSHANRVGANRIGTVGQPLPGVEQHIAEDGEILVRGDNMTSGYHKNADATAELLDDEGWLHTGDLGTVDPDGFCTIVGRKKELIVTAGGKNIAPNMVEGLLKQHPLIGQVCVVGDRKPFLSALVVLDGEAAPGWAAEHGIAATDVAAMAGDPQVLAEVQRAVDEANSQLARVEHVRKFTLLPTEWTPESGELTPSMKLKRNIVVDSYADEIAALYAGGDPAP